MSGHLFGVAFSSFVWQIWKFADQGVSGIHVRRVANDCVSQRAWDTGFDLRQSLRRKTRERFFLRRQRSQVYRYLAMSIFECRRRNSGTTFDWDHPVGMKPSPQQVVV